MTFSTASAAGPCRQTPVTQIVGKLIYYVSLKSLEPDPQQ